MQRFRSYMLRNFFSLSSQFLSANSFNNLSESLVILNVPFICLWFLFIHDWIFGPKRGTYFVHSFVWIWTLNTLTQQMSNSHGNKTRPIKLINLCVRGISRPAHKFSIVFFRVKSPVKNDPFTHIHFVTLSNAIFLLLQDERETILDQFAYKKHRKRNLHDSRRKERKQRSDRERERKWEINPQNGDGVRRCNLISTIAPISLLHKHCPHKPQWSTHLCILG